MPTNGYGAGLYNVNIYGQAAYVDAIAAISVSSAIDADGQQVDQGTAAITVSSTVTSTAQKTS